MKKFFLLLALLLPACATVTLHKTQQFPVAKKGMGIVYFYRDAVSVGSPIPITINHRKKDIGALPYGTYFYYNAKLGKQWYVAEMGTKHVIGVTVTEGKAYYYKVEVLEWLPKPKIKLIKVSNSKARKEMKKLRYVTLDKKSRKRLYPHE